MTSDSLTASPREIFLVSFPNITGATIEAIRPSTANTIVPVMIPGAANPYDSIAMKKTQLLVKNQTKKQKKN